MFVNGFVEFSWMLKIVLPDALEASNGSPGYDQSAIPLWDSICLLTWSRSQALLAPDGPAAAPSSASSEPHPRDERGGEDQHCEEGPHLSHLSGLVVFLAAARDLRERDGEDERPAVEHVLDPRLIPNSVSPVMPVTRK